MVTENGSASQPAITSTNHEHVVKRVSDNRRSNKPIMEKRRRARINNCLNQLKTLILDAMKKDPARHSKLEKADILEMTVKHLQTVQRIQSSDPAVASKFRAGFSECASEVGRYSGLEPAVKRRLLQHLATCLNQQQQPETPTSTSPTPSTSPPPSQPTTTKTTSGESLVLIQSGANEFQAISQQQLHALSRQHNPSGGVHLVPTRLPNGDYALVLPATAAAIAGVPLMMPMPTRTPSTASASSASSTSSSSSLHYASSESPEPMDAMRYSPPMQKPLSLVMRKCEVKMEEDDADEDGDDEDDKPWRPW